ncbi:sensor histidine kinase [Vibrio renipiscarius]|uniref:histidine kinase n=1 Tax=Vibrio renipiscarius TaxID=1461322 RepID=A0A0C2K9N7_9VIBR|nr:sensor histidine kinase [Vibrio renipiscarius]KII75281.1 histidine kinase [Vibrio renipiscarius]KII78733.1 histidine kinase [Vibrio renipiscarius]
MRRVLFWRLFIVLALGGVIFFSLLHSAALISNEKMSYLAQQHQQEILDWGVTAQQFIDDRDHQGLDEWLAQLASQENTWVTVVKSQIDVVSGNGLNPRFWSGYGIGRNVEWKIHLDFPDNPIMEVALSPSNHHFLIILPERMRPGGYMSHAFWLFRVVIPFIALLSLTVYLYRSVMRPLRGFQQATKAFSQGNYQARVSDYLPLGDDEVSHVAKTFDMMADRTERVIEHNRNLIAEMSHEIRTPLARVEMATDCVENHIDTDTMVERIRSEVKNIRQMAEDTLTLAWLENERPNLCQESFDLVELLDAIIDDARFEYPDRTISCNIPASIPLTHSNQRALSQALENIIRNGLRYTPAGDILIVTACLSQRAVHITISDSGPGLEPSLTKTIFRPFFKANNQQGARKGFGVGLALAKRHIEAVNGTIEAKNRRASGLDMVIELPS